MMHMVTATKADGHPKRVLLQREGVVLADPRDGFTDATLFARLEDAEAAVLLLSWMRDNPRGGGLEKLEGARLSARAVPAAEAGAPEAGVVAILPAGRAEAEDAGPAGFVHLWSGNGPQRTGFPDHATLFADKPGTDGAAAFLQARFRKLAAAGEGLAGLGYDEAGGRPLQPPRRA